MIVSRYQHDTLTVVLSRILHPALVIILQRYYLLHRDSE